MTELSLRAAHDGYLARDFVETAEGLLFAVVANGLEKGRVLCSLRYVRAGGELRKLGTSAANALLRQDHPHYLFHSGRRDVQLHGVPPERITRHYQPAGRLAEIARRAPRDELEKKVCRLAELIGGGAASPAWLGVTGSLLAGAHRSTSDIDLVTYGRARFSTARARLRQAVADGHLAALSDDMWYDAYRRRDCSLTFDEYLWHERRKANKCSCDGTKVDLSCVLAEGATATGSGAKVRRAVIRARVHEDRCAFDYPARYGIVHTDVREIVCFTATYAGQAWAGELVEAAGWLERADGGTLRLVIGTSREATGEYLKVIGPPAG